jgi:alpha-glucosidase
MKNAKDLLLVTLMGFCSITVLAQELKVASPDNQIVLTLRNGDLLRYSVSYGGRSVVENSKLGFEFQGEPRLDGNFGIVGQKSVSILEHWIPVVKSKHALVLNHYQELKLNLKEKSGQKRAIDLEVRAFNDGVAFRYKLYHGGHIGLRKITKELTTFSIPNDPKAWIVEYGGYSTSNESEFMEHQLSYLTNKSIAGLPLLMDAGQNCWMAITEAKIEHYPGFYLGTNGAANQLTTKLVPLPGEAEEGVKATFSDDLYTPWRVLMIGDSPGKLIESEIIQNLNDSCALKDPSWIAPGKSAWDHWWSGEVKMEMPVIKQYIDLASEMGWKYMLVDWQWYGPFNTPDADITKWAPQIDMPEIIRYAAVKNVKILLWLYSSDVNRNSAYKKAFPLYKKWGISGIKIDFMDRDDQEMVDWYHEIIACAAENQLLLDFHGAYKPDGIIRTYPNMITREGVMGNEYYKFSTKMSPEHNVKLAFTRMLAGQMDYTPGGFLNVTQAQFKKQTPALVWNTRAAELSKFVIYESPLTVVCDHPDHIQGQPGADFLKIVPTVWDDTKFISGYPGDYIAMAKRSGDQWFVGIMNNSIGKKLEVKLDFLPEGRYEMANWSDSKESDNDPKLLLLEKRIIKSNESIKVAMAKNGGFVATFKKIQF